MEFKEPRFKKRRSQLQRPPALPVTFNSATTLKFSSCFNGFSVKLSDGEAAKKLNSMGCFGKANLTRNRPGDAQVEILRNRQFVLRKKHFPAKSKPRKVLVVPDSDSESDYFTGLKVRYEIDRGEAVENLSLSLEEAYFLMNDVGCLTISFEYKELDAASAWELFNESDECFTNKYIVYFYYRAKNWVVKPGIKFGGDFVLYKEDPDSYHASYVVVIDLINEKNVRPEGLCYNFLHLKELHGLNRLCETAGKELLICQIIWPDAVEIKHSDDINKVTIKEILVKRWLSKEHKEEL